MMGSVLKMMGFVLKMMDFVLEMMGVVLKMMGFAGGGADCAALVRRDRPGAAQGGVRGMYINVNFC